MFAVRSHNYPRRVVVTVRGHTAGGFLGAGRALCFDLSAACLHFVSIYNICIPYTNKNLKYIPSWS